MALGKTMVLMPLPAVMVGSWVAQASCESSRVTVQMLGTGGPEVFGERASTRYLESQTGQLSN